MVNGRANRFWCLLLAIYGLGMNSLLRAQPLAPVAPPTLDTLSTTNDGIITDSTTLRLPCLAIAQQPRKGRIIGASAVSIGAYSGTLLFLNQAWYSQYPRSSFHFFNDNAGWLQVDKVGHVWTAYIEAYYTAELYRWAGVPNKKSAWIGAGAGFLFQAGLETLDGFSEAWGASLGDMAANTAGALLMAGQMAAWNEQRIWLKFSAHRPNYGALPEAVQQRTRNLYGTTLPESILKDYNGQSYWLSVNPASFLNKSGKTHFPKWLNIAIGYGADGMLGAEKNSWELPDGSTYDYSQWQRYRQYYLSIDIDMTRLPVRSRFWRMALGMLNCIKIPAPALEYNSKGEWKLHALYW
jgi:hypothetical protein